MSSRNLKNLQEKKRKKAMMGQKVPMISTTEVTKVELEFTNESMDTLNLQREVTPHAAI